MFPKVNNFIILQQTKPFFYICVSILKHLYIKDCFYIETFFIKSSFFYICVSKLKHLYINNCF